MKPVATSGSTFRKSAPVPRREYQSGFGLIEIMIGIVILGSVLAWAFRVEQRGEDQGQGRTKAEGLASFQHVAIQYFGANRSSIEKAMSDGTDAALWCKLDVAADGTGGTVANSTTLHTCAFDTTWLKFKNLLPANMQVNANGGRYAAIVRQIYSGASPTGADDMLVVLYQPGGSLTAVAADPRRSDELMSGMETMGGTGGLVPVGNMAFCTTKRSSATYQVCGNGWTANLADFVSPAQVTTFGLALPN